MHRKAQRMADKMAQSTQSAQSTAHNQRRQTAEDKLQQCAGAILMAETSGPEKWPRWPNDDHKLAS